MVTITLKGMAESILARSKKTPVHTGWLSRPRYWIVINWFYIDEKAPSKRYKI